MNRIDNIENRYWMWTVLWETVPRVFKKQKKRYIRCMCDCWKISDVSLHSLLIWESTCCGCRDNIWVTTHWMYWTRIYKIWVWLKNRCTNINNQAWKRYWWIWIKCKRETFHEFYNDMLDWYSDLLSIDRIDTNWDYCKENCRRSTMKEQANNKTDNRFIEHNWEYHTMKQWSEIIWINYRTLSTRINRDHRTIAESLKKYI